MVKRRVTTRRVPKNMRRRKRRVINFRRLALNIVCALLGIVLLSFLFTSPNFYITRRKVIGADIVPQSEILKNVQIASGTNIFLLKRKPIETRISSNPIIKAVHLHLKLPNTLLIQVIERQAEYILDTGHAFFEVDSSGVPFRIVQKYNPGIPVICYALDKNPVLGRPITIPEFKSAMDTLGLAQRAGLVGITKISVDQSNDLCLNVRDKYDIKLGRPDQLSEKLKIAVNMERKPGLRDSLEYIDVSAPGGSVYKLRGGVCSPGP